MKLSVFLEPYGLKVKQLEALSGQSPQTLRNWFASGKKTDKAHLITCLIASHNWRTHHLIELYPKDKVVPDKTLTEYLKPHNIKPDELAIVSGQSLQTLRNWLKSPYKFLMIDIMIDAVNWLRFIRETMPTEIMHLTATLNEALLLPIVKNQNKTKFGLTNFVQKRVRRKPEFKYI